MVAIGLFSALVATAVSGVQTAQTPASAPPASTAQVEVYARQYGGDGKRTMGMAGNNGPDSTTGYVWSDEALCSLAASGRAPGSAPAVGWRFVARVTARTADEFSVRVEWQRLSETASRTVDVRLRMNEHSELDRVEPAAVRGCGAATLRLEVSIGPPALNQRLILGPGGFSGRGSGAAAGASGGGTARGGGGGAGAAQSAAAGPQTDVEALRLRLEVLREVFRVQGKQEGLDLRTYQMLDEVLRVSRRPMLDAELWLVHKAPGGASTQTEQRRLVSFSTAVPFAFDPVVISTPNGAVTVQVNGVLRMNPDAVSPLTLEIKRRIRGDGPPRIDSEGGSFQSMTMPKPDEVLSFELPPSREAGRTVPAGHEFSLRLRLVQK